MPGPQPTPISPRSLHAHFGTAASPLIVDVRRAPAFDADDTLIAGALRRLPEDAGAWARALPAGRPIVAYCVYGHEVSQSAAAALSAAGHAAAYLEGGITAWRDQGLPTRRKWSGATNRWVTRERPKVDRIACPWLVRRFIDPDAEFLYVPTEQVFETASARAALAYDIPGAEPFTHDGPLCSFDGFIKTFGLTDPALDRLAVIVRGADTGVHDLAPQAAGLVALSLGLSANFPDDDHAMLAHGMVMYDALYAWCRSLTGETHNWKPAA
jgi:rhodanese-related sulfurtransferase